jgi:hypothetical protein
MLLLDEPSRVAGDHPVFVGRHDADGHGSVVAGDYR